MGRKTDKIRNECYFIKKRQLFQPTVQEVQGPLGSVMKMVLWKGEEERDHIVRQEARD